MKGKKIGILKNIIYPIYRFFIPVSLRYSIMFSRVQTVWAYSSQEKILKMAMDFAASSKLEGDYLEFGIYEGNTFVPAFHLAQKRNLKSMNFYAFDSFKGLPKIKGVDAEGFCHFDEGAHACDINKFKKIISKKRIDLKKVKIVPGWYSEVLNEETKRKIPLKKASIIFIDCDLYESTVLVLDFITEYIQDGTIIIFDDWFSFRGNPNKG
ncbi:MAG: TylF/MycF family methyltransferase, partial [Nanoarchaeota archaeon]|nr:TylF/MycF family methyltransferase [Nanoarchaeota archaeon]